MPSQIFCSMTSEQFEEFISTIFQKEFKKLNTLSVVKSDDEFITRNEVIKILKISLPTLSEWCKNGQIPFHRIGRSIRFSKREIAKVLENNKS